MTAIELGRRFPETTRGQVVALLRRGVRTGLDFGPLVGVRAYYWRGVDGDFSRRDGVQSWGAEAQFNLNAGRGVKLPLTQFLSLTAAARDYVTTRDSSRLQDANGTGQLRHHWQYTAGLSMALGRRSATPRVAARTRSDTVYLDRTGMRVTVRDSVRMDGERLRDTRTVVVTARGDTLRGAAADEDVRDRPHGGSGTFAPTPSCATRSALPCAWPFARRSPPPRPRERVFRGQSDGEPCPRHPLAVSLDIAIGSRLVDVSPLSTLGAPCIATLADPTAQRTPFRLLPTCGLTMTAGGALCGQLAAGWVARLRGHAPTRPLRGPRASAA